jgi:hypothetical protein
MSKEIQGNGIEKFMKNFTSLQFSQQKDVLPLRNEFSNILPNESQNAKNVFIKHIYPSRMKMLEIGVQSDVLIVV